MKHPPVARTYTIAGRRLACPVCSHERFWARSTLLNTAGLSFMGWDWANRQATNLVCGNCSYMFWFHEAPAADDGPHGLDRGGLL